MFKIKIEFLKFYFLALFLLATNTIGFDIYFHAISVADFQLIDYYNPAWVVSGYELPRYILLHYLLWLITCFGVLPLLPILAGLYALALMKVVSHKYTHGFIKYAVVAMMVLNIIFTSALGISLLLIGLGVLTRVDDQPSNSYLCICLGSILHPIGFAVGLFVLLVLRGWVYMAALALLLHFSHLLAMIFQSNYVGHQRVFEISDLMLANSLIHNKLVGKLSVEAFALFALFAMSLSLFFLSKIREIRLVLNQVSGLVTRVSVRYVISFFLVVALVRSYPSHFNTGGPLAVLSFQGDQLPHETLNIMSAAWLSPYLLYDSVKSNQYHFRGG